MASILTFRVQHYFKVNFYTLLYALARGKHHGIDNSLMPVINEIDLEEKFVRGSGPGGSAVNKNANCVVLIHKPSGVVVKCHESRSLDVNRTTARRLLISRLDDVQNGENSVSNQIKIQEKKVSYEQDRRRKKLENLKSTWRKREGLE